MRESNREHTRRNVLHSIAGALAVGSTVPGYQAAQSDAGSRAAPLLNYRVPRRDYVVVSVGPRSIHVEKALQTNDKVLAQKAVDRLVTNIDKALGVLPAHASFGLRNIRYFLMYGPKAKGGGRDNGLEYMHPRNPADRPELDPRWSDSIVVPGVLAAERIATA